MRTNKPHSSVYKLAVGAMVAALAIVIMAIGVFLEIADLSAAMLASVLVWFLQLEFSYANALTCYLTVAILGFVLLPSKLPAFYFSVLFGWYPIAKFAVENRFSKRLIRYTLNAFLMAFAVISEEALAQAFFGYTKNTIMSVAIITITFICYILYDFFLVTMKVIYFKKIRKRIFKK